MIFGNRWEEMRHFVDGFCRALDCAPNAHCVQYTHALPILIFAQSRSLLLPPPPRNVR